MKTHVFYICEKISQVSESFIWVRTRHRGVASTTNAWGSRRCTFNSAAKIYGDQRLTRERRRERKNGTLSQIIWEWRAVAATYKAVVGAERASRRSNLFAQRSGASDANGYSSRRRSRPLLRRVGRRLRHYIIPFPVVPSPPSPSLNHHLWGQRLHRRRWHTRSPREERRRLGDPSCCPLRQASMFPRSLWTLTKFA